jgi:hypothetical protein
MLFTRLELVLDDLRMATSVVVLGEICAGLGRPAANAKRVLQKSQC